MVASVIAQKIGKKEAIKYSQNCLELIGLVQNFMELRGIVQNCMHPYWFHILKSIIYAADTRMELIISVDFNKMEARVSHVSTVLKF